MYCSKCGAKAEEGSNFCPECGAPVSAEARRKEEVQEQHVTESPIKQWFEFEQIRDNEALSDEQREWLKEGSVTIFGPFNIFVRLHWDMVAAWFALNVASEIIYRMGSPLLFSFALLAGFILLFGYMYRHGRRLAWNRREWDSFDDFMLSEKKWKPWGWVGIISFVLLNTLGFFAEDPGYEQVPLDELEAV